MPQKSLTHLDLGGNQLLKHRVENLATDPVGAELYSGRVWFNTTDGQLRWYDGSAVRTALPNPMTAAYDLIRGGTGGAPVALPKGANRTSLITNDAGVVGWAVAATRSTTVTVAASTASAAVKALADFVCTGTADQTVINAAIASLPAPGGTVQLSEGAFSITGAITLTAANQTLCGMSREATTLRVPNAAGGGVSTALLASNFNYARFCDLTIDGNRTGTGNAAQTGMIGVSVVGLNPQVERVRAINIVAFGVLINATCQNALVRDCLVENAGNQGYIVRAAAGQPTRVSGCIARSCASTGFNCDNGPVVFTDCQSLGNSGYGFTGGAADTLWSGCIAMANTLPGWLCSGLSQQLIGCKAISNAGGFQVANAHVVLSGCFGYTNGSYNFQDTNGADLTLYSGCASYGAGTAFLHDGTSSHATYEGCRAVSYGTYGFQIASGEVSIRSSHLYGGAGSFGVQITGGGYHTVEGCRVKNNGGHGINVASVNNVSIQNNVVSDSSISGTGGYSHITVLGTDCYVGGNTCRRGPGAQIAAYGIDIVAGSVNTMVGLNDLYLSGASGEIRNGGTGTRWGVATRDLQANAVTQVTSGTFGGPVTNVAPSYGSMGSFSFTCTGAPCILLISGIMSNTNPGLVYINYQVDSGPIVQTIIQIMGGGGGGNYYQLSGFAQLTPAAGTHTMTILGAGGVAGTVFAYGGSVAILVEFKR